MNAAYTNPLYRISQWGAAHIWPARILITIGHFVLAGSALFLGVVLLPYKAAPLLLTQLLLFLIAGGIAVAYAKKKRRGWDIRKKLEGGFLLCGFLLLLLSGPALREAKVNFGGTPAFAIAKNPPAGTKKAQTKLGRFLKGVARTYVEGPLWLKILNVVGVLFFAAGAGVGIAVLACNLSCNGYEILGTIIFFLGGAAILAGIIHFCFRIFESKARADRRTANRAGKQK